MSLINLVSINDIVDDNHVVIFTRDAALRVKVSDVDLSAGTILAEKRGKGPKIL